MTPPIRFVMPLATSISLDAGAYSIMVDLDIHGNVKIAAIHTGSSRQHTLEMNAEADAALFQLWHDIPLTRNLTEARLPGDIAKCEHIRLIIWERDPDLDCRTITDIVEGPRRRIINMFNRMRISNGWAVSPLHSARVEPAPGYVD